MSLDETRFIYAIGKVLAQEGGYSNDAHDAGGPTMFGISLKFLTDNKIDSTNNPCMNPTIDDIKNLTKDQAKALYKTFFWDKYKLNQINSLLIASNVLSIAVLMGGTTAIKLLQHAVNSLHEHKIIEDGLIGRDTLLAVNTTEPDALNKAFKQECLNRVDLICMKNPDLLVFKKGWYNRINGF